LFIRTFAVFHLSLDKILNTEIINNFSRQNIVVIGDLVADQFLHGTISRVSREAPVFILRHNQTETLAGGAANCAVNVASLGGKVSIIGVIGQDETGDKLLEVLNKNNVNCEFTVQTSTFKTTTKVRVLAGQHYAARQQIVRIDYENETKIDIETSDKLKKNLLSAIENADAVIFSDYNYGVVTVDLFNLAKSKNIPILVDSRFCLQNFRGATSATPNQDEVEQILGENFTEADCVRLLENLDFKSLLVTRGNKGMLLIEKNKSPLAIDAIGSKEPVDVTGAGDTVIATYALGLASGLNFADAANLANHAGGIVVMKKGTAAVTPEELLNSINR
jgi:D-glycero-beta-D-manno-heptose-7-phosphate kinase